jgi:hypothetical protein
MGPCQAPDGMLFAAAGFYLCPGIRGRRCGRFRWEEPQKMAIGGSGERTRSRSPLPSAATQTIPRHRALQLSARGRAADTCKPIRGSAISILAPSSWRRVSPKTPSHPTVSRNCRSGHLAIDGIEGRKQYSHLPKAGLIGDSMPISSEEPAFDTLNARTDLPGG